MPNPHPSYAIVARAMRELAVCWPESVDVSEAAYLIVVDLSQSNVRGNVRENRMAVSDENCGMAERSLEWLEHQRLIEFPDGGARDGKLTQKGLDLLRSTPAFLQFQQASDHLALNALVPILDGELSQLLGPGFLSWLQASCSEK